LRPFDIRLRDIKIWEKGLTYANNRQVSPYERTKHTNYRHLNNFEYIYIFKKDGKRDIPLDLDLKSKISKKEYYDWVGGIWNIKPVHRQDSHPAEFPEEIPRRLKDVLLRRRYCCGPCTGFGNHGQGRK
jgi:DNA modification methylase